MRGRGLKHLVVTSPPYWGLSLPVRGRGLKLIINDIGQSKNLYRLIHGNTYSVHQLLWGLFPNQTKRPFLYREEIAREQMGYSPNVRGGPIFYLVSQERPLDETDLFAVESKDYSPKLKHGEGLAFKLRANPVVARKMPGKNKSYRHDIVMDTQRILLLDLCNDLGILPEGSKSKLKQKILTTWQASKNFIVKEKLRAIIEENVRFADLLDQRHTPDRLLYLAIRASIDKALENWLLNIGDKKGFHLVRREKDGHLKFQAESYRWHALPQKRRNAGFSTVDFDGKLEVCDSEKFIATLFNGIGPAKAFGCGLILVRRV